MRHLETIAPVENKPLALGCKCRLQSDSPEHTLSREGLSGPYGIALGLTRTTPSPPPRDKSRHVCEHRASGCRARAPKWNCTGTPHRPELKRWPRGWKRGGWAATPPGRDLWPLQLTPTLAVAKSQAGSGTTWALPSAPPLPTGAAYGRTGFVLRWVTRSSGLPRWLSRGWGVALPADVSPAAVDL